MVLAFNSIGQRNTCIKSFSWRSLRFLYKGKFKRKVALLIGIYDRNRQMFEKHRCKVVYDWCYSLLNRHRSASRQSVNKIIDKTECTVVKAWRPGTLIIKAFIDSSCLKDKISKGLNSWEKVKLSADNFSGNNEL